MRVGNPNCFAQIATATDAGLLREMAVMQAFQMELARKNMELMDRLTAIAALSFLSRMEGTTGRDMDDLYRMRRKPPPFRAGDIRRVRRICVSN